MSFRGAECWTGSLNSQENLGKCSRILGFRSDGGQKEHFFLSSQLTTVLKLQIQATHLCSPCTLLVHFKRALLTLLEMKVFKFAVSTAFLVAQLVKTLPAVQETLVWFLGWEDPLEMEMATHSSTLAWKTPWTEEPGRLQSMGLHVLDTT